MRLGERLVVPKVRLVCPKRGFLPLVLPECDGAGLPCLESQPEDRRGEEDNHGNSGRLDERSCDETRLRNVPEFLPSFQESGRPDSYGVHGNLWDESA